MLFSNIIKISSDKQPLLLHIVNIIVAKQLLKWKTVHII